ncbi:hypothetical protein MMC07_004793 [Pseudocyphellaria aurata]|nr:hypothetical protein [Pseudocyphellaria aurata]
MADEIKNVIVIGAGGNLGPAILEAVDKDSHFTVSVLSREGSSSTFPSHIKVHRIDGSYPEDQLLAALKGQDAVVLTLPPTDVQLHKNVIDASIKAGVKRFIPSEFGSDTSEQVIVDAVPINKAKQDVTQYLQSKEDTGLSWTGIINGSFFDWGITTGFLGFDLNARKVTIYDGGKASSPLTNLSTVGAANEILASLEKATGGEKWEVSNRDTAEAKATGFEKLGKGDFSGIADLILAGVWGPLKEVDYSSRRELANESLGLPKPEPLDVIIEKIVKGEKV